MTVSSKQHPRCTFVALVSLLLLLTMGVTGCEEPVGGGKCRTRALGPPDGVEQPRTVAMSVGQDERPPGQADFRKPGKPRPKPKPTRTRAAPQCTKSNSPVWKSLKPYKGSLRTNGKSGKAQRFYEWDYTHNDIEEFGPAPHYEHLGSRHPSTNKLYKGPVPGRNLKGKLK
jgi:Cytotoxic